MLFYDLQTWHNHIINKYHNVDIKAEYINTSKNNNNNSTYNNLL